MACPPWTVAGRRTVPCCLEERVLHMAGAARHNQSSVELFAIYEVSKILSSSLDLQQTLREVLRLLSYHLQMRRGGGFLHPQGSGLRPVAGIGVTRGGMGGGPDPTRRGVVGRRPKTGGADGGA